MSPDEKRRLGIGWRGTGYAHGKDKAHVELRTWEGSHAGDCGCELCMTVRILVDTLVRQPRLNWLAENHAARS
jgi:hypothetical protein